MGNIKKQLNSGTWDVLASGKSTGISVTNPKLLDEGATVESVDEILEKHQDAIDKLQHNVSWLAKHGGGGSGGGGSDVTEATCDIAVNDSLTGSDITVNEQGLKISLLNISAKVTKAWNVTVRIGATLIATTNLSYTSNTFWIALDKISPYLINHTGNLSVGASYEDETNGIYGSSTWSGTILETVVNIKTSDYSFTTDNINTAQLVYNYSVGIVGAYTMILSISKEGEEIVNKEYDININSTTEQVKTINFSSLIETSDVVGVYDITTTLSYNNNPLVRNEIKSTATVVSNTILIASTTMSTNANYPTEVSMSASILLSFTAYLQNATTYKYTVQIGDTIIKDSTSGTFGKKVSDYIPVSNSWATEGNTEALKLTVTSGEQSTTKTYYVKFVKAKDTFLPISDTSKAHLLSEFLSRSYNTGDSSFSIKVEGFEQGGSSYDVTSLLKTYNGNDLSVITKLSSGLPYLRISNGAYTKLDSFHYNDIDYTLPNLIVTNAFTMSICFKADYHPDDDRTILFCGTTDVTTGDLTTGISIDVHDIYINNRSVTKLTDETVNSVDITCQKLEIQDTDAKGEQITYNAYLIKVYVDGVLTAVSKESEFPKLSDGIYLGGRLIGTEVRYLCDCNIYNLHLYDSALTDFDIMVNYINNKVSTDYSDNQPNFSIIAEELKTNFCERDSDGNITSHMFKNGEYTIDFLLDGTEHLDATNLNNYAKVLGIPIMLIDVSTDPNWTFEAFVTQQTAGNVSLPETSGRTIQYWDPSGNNTSVVNITDATIELQGTSTLSDSVKNLNITVPNDTVFIPKDTWFPEQTYTLKADVVDSSHSNNASIGKFINEELGYNETTGAFFPFDSTAISNVYNSTYKKNQQNNVSLKHTVEGFPVFLIMKFNTNTSSTISVTPLGIYSFNLGRNAYRNLGFKKVTSIADSAGDIPTINTFPYLLEKAKITETESDANWIEIKYTTSLADLLNVKDALPEDFDSSVGDFWQDDSSILDARYEVRYGGKDSPSEYNNFKTFVSNVMSLPIEGCSTTDVLGNRDQKQITGSYDKYQVDAESNYTKTGAKEDIIVDSNLLPADLGFNTDSAYKYFVIGLLFGLIDNFGKNSTYRSWNNGQYYIDFYDLDCALKGDNQGNLSVTPDLWIKYLYNDLKENKNYGYICETFNIDETYVGTSPNKIQTGSGTVVSANHNKLWLSLDTPFFRGYKGENSINSLYTQYWYQLRIKMDELASAAGYTDFADYFIDEFYIKQTKNCGPLLFNYDYKLKYLLQFQGNEYTVAKDLSKLHGRKIAIARDWLKKHIAFMDSLFYWRDSKQTLNFRNDLDSRASNTVLNTPDSLPMKSNTPIILYSSIGNAVQTFYFMQSNTKTYINASNNSSNSPMAWNFSNSPNIIEYGDSNTPLSTMNIQVLSSTPNTRSLNNVGYPAITELLLGGNKGFLSSFNLDSFSTGKVSELRTLDFNNTSGESFALNLVNTTSTGTTYTKFSKLTKINIGNSSCVSNITIPAIPLNELILTNSAITNFVLTSQKYISNVDLTGCTKLKTIEITKCAGYKELNISNLANLESITIVDCEGITAIKVDNCSLLKKINIEYCSNLETIQINNCSSLTGITTDNYVRVANCNNLKTLDFSSNNNLQKIVITGCDRASITTLKLHETKVTDLSSSSDFNTDLKLNLVSFTELSTFTCYTNSAVKIIAFANNKDKPIPITNTFQKCYALERVYGCVLITNTSGSLGTGIFRDCSKFSIHGTTATTWKSRYIRKNGVVQTPWEILKTTTAEFDTLTWAETFASGDTVTNIKFTNTANQTNELFRGTSITQFDVYYTLAMLALSEVTVSQSLYHTFYAGALFDWSTGNYPSKYTFYRCSMITAINEPVIIKGSVFLPSPTVVDGEVTVDDGLLSPLINLTSVHYLAGPSASIVCSKYLFRRKEGNYPIKSLTYTRIKRVCDSDEIASVYSNNNDSYVLSNYTKLGNYDEFFNNMPNLEQINAFNYESCDIINYSSLIIPATVKMVNFSFNSNGGYGTLDLKTTFPSGSICTDITRSFQVGANSSLIELAGKVNFPIDNDTFSTLSKLVNVGYGPNTYWGGGVLDTSFNGKGLNKYINGSTFPFNIVSNLTKLQVFAGFFKDVTATLSSVPALPGNMFTNNTELYNVASLFYNLGFEYKLSGDSFKTCTNLNNVAYFCCCDSSDNSNLTGSIPYHLFYHGIGGSYSKTFKGTNQEAEPDEDFDLNTLLSTTLNFNTVNNKITTMVNCFKNCVNIEPYSIVTLDTESNERYSPYKWMYDETSKTWSAGTDSCSLDASWSYDGVSTRSSLYSYLDNYAKLANTEALDKPEYLNYMCAPDLFRYCINKSSLNVTGVFEDCGKSYTEGITGRIPPYLLRPINKVSSISDMFKNCIRLSSYIDEDSTIYQIPKDFFKYAPSITKLTRTFQRLAFQPKTNLAVFSELVSPLDIRGIMQGCVFGKNSSTWNITGVFSSNTIYKISGAFAMASLSIDDSTLGVADATGVIYSVPNSTTITDNFNFDSSKIPATTNIGYVYYGWGSKASDSKIANSNHNYN